MTYWLTPFASANMWRSMLWNMKEITYIEFVKWIAVASCPFYIPCCLWISMPYKVHSFILYIFVVAMIMGPYLLPKVLFVTMSLVADHATETRRVCSMLVHVREYIRGCKIVGKAMAWFSKRTRLGGLSGRVMWTRICYVIARTKIGN